MIEITIRRVSPKDTATEPLTIFNLTEPGEVVAENSLWRVRLSDSAERARTRDAEGAACYEDASNQLLRLVHSIIGQALKQRPSKPTLPQRKSPKSGKPSGLKKGGRLGR